MSSAEVFSLVSSSLILCILAGALIFVARRVRTTLDREAVRSAADEREMLAMATGITGVPDRAPSVPVNGATAATRAGAVGDPLGGFFAGPSAAPGAPDSPGVTGVPGDGGDALLVAVAALADSLHAAADAVLAAGVDDATVQVRAARVLDAATAALGRLPLGAVAAACRPPDGER